MIKRVEEPMTHETYLTDLTYTTHLAYDRQL